MSMFPDMGQFTKEVQLLRTAITQQTELNRQLHAMLQTLSIQMEVLIDEIRTRRTS